MLVELKTAGGFAAPLMTRQYTVDSAKLPEAMQQKLAALAEAAIAEPRPEANPRLRDAMSYEVTITHPDRKETIVAYDGGVPPAMSQLIKFVKSQA